VKRREGEDVMERLISLFREAREDDGWPGRGVMARGSEESAGEALTGLNPEPLYFQELLEYLRERKQRRGAGGRCNA
jgi:hypothetical protein